MNRRPCFDLLLRPRRRPFGPRPRERPKWLEDGGSKGRANCTEAAGRCRGSGDSCTARSQPSTRTDTCTTTTTGSC